MAPKWPNQTMPDNPSAVMRHNGNQETAFVLAGGGNPGAVQVGMLKALARQHIVPDFVVGASVGAINGACYAAEPNEHDVARLEFLWLKLRRADMCVHFRGYATAMLLSCG